VPYFLTYYQWIFDKSNTTGATSGGETGKPFGAPKFTPVLIRVRLTNS